MNNKVNELRKSIETGFINSKYLSEQQYQPELLTNDKQGKKILITIKEQLESCDHFWFSVAFLTSSGLASIIQDLLNLEERNISGKILVSQYLNFTEPEALKKLLRFKNIELRISINSNFHAKGYLFKQGELNHLIIGSSNLTASALSINKEWNLKVTSKNTSGLSITTLEEFNKEFNRSTIVTNEFIKKYELIFIEQKANNEKITKLITEEIKPNKIQEDALKNLEQLRINGEKKALLISATGTGKTYLSAFDAYKFNPNRLLFIVHRKKIAKDAMNTYENIFKQKKTCGLYSGKNLELEKDFIFSTVQTLSKQEHLKKFDPKDFDYIVIDETHRVNANSYQHILNYFSPKFILGMTATPERTDGNDIYKYFDHNIAYEIRLQSALEMNILSSFHYYGITDVSVNGKQISENSALNLLIEKERIKNIINNINLYGCDNGNVRGLIFCSNIDECEQLSLEFNKRGFKTLSLTNKTTEEEREIAIDRLESIIPEKKIDYIFSVDILNEGVDIPSVNQIVMLRPTQSAIVFVQQLGRGLRKNSNKKYLTVIDFIGNYKNNFLIPIALFGDNSYNKDNLKKIMSSGNKIIPGTSTVSFDRIAEKRIYESINNANLQKKQDLTKDYISLKLKLGRAPLMMDFIKYGSRDPFAFVKYSRSFFNFAEEFEDTIKNEINKKERKLLEFFANDINNSKRIGESIILKELLLNNKLFISKLKKILKNNYKQELLKEDIISYVNNLNCNFVTEVKEKKHLPISQIYNFKIISYNDEFIEWDNQFKTILKNKFFIKYLTDNTDYSIKKFDDDFNVDLFFNGFQLYKKYSRKDVFRILNWSQNPIAQNVGGYIISKDGSNCPIFVNYHKSDDISESTKYEDYFINQYEFNWMSKSQRTLNSKDIKSIINYKSGLRLPLFIKKDKNEIDFYYMGDVVPQINSFEQNVIDNKPVVKVVFDLEHPVDNDIYRFLLMNN